MSNASVVPTEADPIMNWVLEAYDFGPVPEDRIDDVLFWEVPAAACAMMVQETLMFEEVLYFYELMGGNTDPYDGDYDIEYRAWNYNRTGIIEQF